MRTVLLARRKTPWWERIYCPVHPKNAYKLVPLEVKWGDYWLHSTCCVTAVPEWINPSILSRSENTAVLFPFSSSPHCYSISVLLWSSPPRPWCSSLASPRCNTGISSWVIALFHSHFLRTGCATSKPCPAKPRPGSALLATALPYLRAVSRAAREEGDAGSSRAGRRAFPSACCRDSWNRRTFCMCSSCRGLCVPGGLILPRTGLASAPKASLEPPPVPSLAAKNSQCLETRWRATDGWN